MQRHPLEAELLEVFRVVHDFPKPGIAFRDITTLLAHPELSKRVLAALVDEVGEDIDAIAGIESRGFLFGMAMALELGLPFIPLRKQGKLPHHTLSVSYALEYGKATIEMHRDAVQPGTKVHVHDDLLATGGSALAAGELISMAGGEVAGYSFLIALDELAGEAVLGALSSNIAILARC